MKYKDNYDIDYSKRDYHKGVDEAFIHRWSPRSFQKADLSHETQTVLFEAARWSPSCFNEQPWVFITNKDENDFPVFLNLLSEQNQQWAKNASLLGFLFARKVFSHSGRDNYWAPFDCGAAWMALTLQARKLGLYTHAMAGINSDETYKVLKISGEKYQVMCGFAIGVIDVPDKLPDAVRENESPNIRKKLYTFWKQGSND